MGDDSNGVTRSHEEREGIQQGESFKKSKVFFASFAPSHEKKSNSITRSREEREGTQQGESLKESKVFFASLAPSREKSILSMIIGDPINTQSRPSSNGVMINDSLAAILE
jgi:hypothetical protein